MPLFSGLFCDLFVVQELGGGRVLKDTARRSRFAFYQGEEVTKRS